MTERPGTGVECPICTGLGGFMSKKRRPPKRRRHTALPPMTGLPRRKRYRPFGNNFDNRHNRWRWNSGE